MVRSIQISWTRRGIPWEILTAAWRYLSVVVPNQMSSAQSLPSIDVLLMGLHAGAFR